MNKKSFFVALAVAALSAFPVCAQTIDVKGNATKKLFLFIIT